MVERTNAQEIEDELVVFFRNSDILSIATRGVATATDEFDGTGAQTTFTLSNSTIVKNVRTVTVDAAAQSFGTDYTVDYDTGIVTFLAAPAAGTDNVDITYDFGSTDKIFSDYPQDNIKLFRYPRVTVHMLGAETAEQALGGTSTLTTYLYTVVAYAEKLDTCETILDKSKDAIMDNKKSLFFVPFHTPLRRGPPLKSPFGESKIHQINLDCQIQFVFETVT